MVCPATVKPRIILSFNSIYKTTTSISNHRCFNKTETEVHIKRYNAISGLKWRPVGFRAAVKV